MSKNKKISIYITISMSALIFLLISFVSIKASFGGLNLNIFEERISYELKLNYSFDTDIKKDFKTFQWVYGLLYLGLVFAMIFFHG